MAPRDAFGPRLRVARERAGITLEAIARSTKIKQSLFQELENNDISHWPAGIFRRAFFREYLAAIGIGSESLVADFVRLFPEDGATKSAVDDASELRLSLADTPETTRRVVLTHIAAAVTDLGLVLLLALAVARLFGLEFWAGATAVALIYYSLATACSGRTPAVGWLTGTRRAPKRMASAQLTAVRDQLRIVPKPAELTPVSQASEAISDERPQRLHAVSG